MKHYIIIGISVLFTMYWNWKTTGYIPYGATPISLIQATILFCVVLITIDILSNQKVSDFITNSFNKIDEKIQTKIKKW